MSRTVDLPPVIPPLGDGARVGGWWHTGEEGRIVCDLCPRDCHLKPGDRGFCFVRENRGGEMVLSTYGRSTGFCIDPIEKKPLNQFYPGSSVLSFGTAGCNLGCKFCQNWDISKSREIERLSESATPEAIAAAAQNLGCRSVAFTYNDPVVWAEYAIDTAKACHAVGVKTVAVTAGYITPQARGPFYEVMDAANVDLKGFTEEFYYKLTSSHLAPVLDTLRWLKHETDVWFEITNLIIPQANDSRDELKRMCDWVLEAVGPDVPLHFTAFHPDFKMLDRGNTPVETLLAAYDIAVRTGLNFVYVGNVQSPREQTTYCPGCKKPLVERSGYHIARYDLQRNLCRHCGTAIAGRYDDSPGTWGPRRQPVRIADYQPKQLISLGSVSTGSSTAVSSSAASVVVQRPEFTPEQDRLILQAGAEILAAAVEQRGARPRDPNLGGAAGMQVLGAFVTAKRGGHLRSCCGLIGQVLPLQQVLTHAAERTANDDPRFPPISPGELPFLDIDVWVLHSLAVMQEKGEARRDAIEIGKHGLTIARGEQRGLLLPGVAVEHQLDAEGFLRQVCQKAGLPPTAWKESDTVINTFEGHEIAGPLASLVTRLAGSAPPPISPQDLAALEEFTGNNVFAHVRGSTPNYFAFGISDANVSGAVVTYRVSADLWWQSQRISLRDRMPLQSTLFGLAETLGKAVAQAQLPESMLRDGRIELSVLDDVQTHGSAAAPDLRGVDPRRRGIMVMERGKSAVVFDTEKSADDLLREALAAGNVHAPEATGVYSLAVLSNVSSFVAAQVPRAQVGGDVRPPGVAGTFYPDDPAELAALVDRCLGTKPAAKSKVPAVMIPHAGLIYSGRIAGETLNQIEIPDTVIIIGPKHTPYGVDWSIAPQAVWQIPGGKIAADPELAKKLAAAVPGLQLDAAAHAREHAIEVELPFLARLAPQTKVVGIAVGGGNLESCQAFARGLAQVLRELPHQPLLIISSDMNHFASDVENRRLDALALEAMETLDPARLLKVCRDNDISMCGVLPAVIVMETLRELGRLSTCTRTGYATSADVSGDKTRVVGYAGMLLS